MKSWVAPLSDEHFPEKESIPERALLMAIVRRAIMDVLGYDIKREERTNVQRDAWLWVMNSRKRGNEPFGIDWVLEHLSIDPERFRKEVCRALNTGQDERLRGFVYGQILDNVKLTRPHRVNHKLDGQRGYRL